MTVDLFDGAPSARALRLELRSKAGIEVKTRPSRSEAEGLTSPFILDKRNDVQNPSLQEEVL